MDPVMKHQKLICFPSGLF